MPMSCVVRCITSSIAGGDVCLYIALTGLWSHSVDLDLVSLNAYTFI